jgi:3-phosphoshikimate 1-carboxyvinyltransferase
MGMSLPEKLDIIPLSKPPSVAVEVPGSKSITNRALVLAALYSKGQPCELLGCLRSEDTEVMIEALRRLDFDVECDWGAAVPRLVVSGEPDECDILALEADLFVANSGTSMRFLTALAALGHGRYRIDGVPRMRERPIQDLLDALGQFGVKARSEHANGCPPVIVETHGSPLPGGRAHIRGEVSSQFLSGLLMVTPRARGDVTLVVEGQLVSRPYVRLTTALMRFWGLRVEEKGHQSFFIPGNQFADQRPTQYTIEPDASAASYFFAAAAIAGGRVTVLGLPEKSLQGDVCFIEILGEMGCRVKPCSSGITVHGGPLRGIDVDMNDISDTVMTLAAVACFADGPTTIRNVAHIRHKETDRLTALATELRRVGAEVDEFPDGLKITPRPLRGAEIETYNDHRMAMSMALIGLRVPGIVIKNPGCVAKTYPNFFTDLEKLRC